MNDTFTRVTPEERYTRQQPQAAEAPAVSFWGMAQKSVQSVVDWQKVLLDVSIYQRINFVEFQKTLLDITAQQSAALADVAQQQAENSCNLFMNLTQRWFEGVTAIQKSFTDIAFGGAQRPPISGSFKRAGEVSDPGRRDLKQDRVERHWDEYRDRIRDQWRELSDEALAGSAGNLDKLARSIQQSYAIGIEEARNQVDEFLEHLAEPADTPREQSAEKQRRSGSRK